MSTGIRALPDYRCVVAIIEGKLQTCRMRPTGELDFFAGQLNWEKVRYPSSEDFLRAAAEVLKVEITAEHLEGYRPATT